MRKKILFLVFILSLIISGCTIATPVEPKLVTDDFYKLLDLYENKTITLEGYILSPDINSELITGTNNNINLRDKPDQPGIMGDSKNISLYINSEDIKKSLIDKYTATNEEWIKVRVSGIIKRVDLAGMPKPVTLLKVSSLVFIK